MRKRGILTIVAAVVASVVVAGGATAAGRYLITNTHQIKPSVMAQLHGTRGPRGFQGAQGNEGLQGAQGQSGPAGIANVQDVSNSTSYCDSSGGSCSVASITATCPAGSYVTGGGAYDDTIQTPISTFASLSSYGAVSDNGSSFSGTLTVTAVCASGAGLQAAARDHAASDTAAGTLAATLRAQRAQG